MRHGIHWTLVAFIVAVIVVMPVTYHRFLYTHSKRLRVIVPDKLYRSGQMTAEGFRDALRKYRIRAVVNLQDDFLDPDLRESFFNASTTKESELCRELGVRYICIAPDLVPRPVLGECRPGAIDEMLEVFDDPSNYPMLIHCKAGLHRTGCMAAVYRMEYQSWTPEQAVEEMKRHGFGDSKCTAANDYVYQYVLTYQRGLRHGKPATLTQMNRHADR